MNTSFIIVRMTQKRDDILREFYYGLGRFTTSLIMANFYASYGEAENVIKTLGTGLYQIDKIYSLRKTKTN